MTIRLDSHRVLVLISLLCLSIYILVKRLYLGEILPFSDHLALTTILRNECGLVFSGAWNPPLLCLNALLGKIFALPPFYLTITLLLKVAMLVGVLSIYLKLSRSDLENKHSLAVALFCILVITIGGGSNFLSGGGDIFTHSTIHSRQWAQVILLFTFTLYLSERYLIASLLLSLAIFLHPANSFHITIILVGSLFLIKDGNAIAKSLIKFTPLVFAALAIQYIATFGLSEILSVVEQFSRDTPTNSILTDSAKVNEWYDFIYRQDPDDLSLIWVLTNERPHLYFPLLAFGIVFAWITERPVSISSFIKQPAVAIVVITVFYFVGCVLVEYFKYPTAILKQLIVVQPRRALYIPILFLIYYIVRFNFEYFGSKKHHGYLNFTILMLFYTFYFWFVGLVNSSSSIPSSFFFITYLCLSVVTTLHTFWHRFYCLVSKLLRNMTVVLLGALVLILAKTMPLVTTSTYDTVQTLFFDWTPRTFQDHLELEAKLQSDNFKSDYLSTVGWINRNTTKDVRFALAGLSEYMVKDFPLLVDHRSSTSLDIYYSRGGTHYLYEEYEKEKNYFEKTLNISVDQVAFNASSSTSALETALKSVGIDQLNLLKTRGGKQIDYLLTTFSLPLAVVFSTSTMRLYSLSN